jgi:hypothetical protein
MAVPWSHLLGAWLLWSFFSFSTSFVFFSPFFFLTRMLLSSLMCQEHEDSWCTLADEQDNGVLQVRPGCRRPVCCPSPSGIFHGENGGGGCLLAAAWNRGSESTESWSPRCGCVVCVPRFIAHLIIFLLRISGQWYQQILCIGLDFAWIRIPVHVSNVFPFFFLEITRIWWYLHNWWFRTKQVCRIDKQQCLAD